MKSLSANSKSYDLIIFTAFFLFAITAYHYQFSSYFPNKNSSLGHDYSYFLPYLLNGYFWFKENGIFEVPWFTPAFCGGVPFFPNPQSMYYSVPQLLTVFFDPLAAVYFTLIIFAAVGYVGFYHLLKDIYRMDVWIASLGATMFMFNGFFAYRMVIGHLTYHSFMLIPFIAYYLLRQKPENTNIPTWEHMSVLIVGVMIAYIIHSGGANYLIPSLLCVAGIALLAEIISVRVQRFWLRFVLASGFGFLFSSAKIFSGILFLKNFPRDMYPLPGIEGLGNMLYLFLSTLFLEKSFTSESAPVVNSRIFFDIHAFEFGITIVPLLILISYGAKQILERKTPQLRRISLRDSLLYSGFILIMCLPIGLNLYIAEWNAFLKNLPYIKNSSSLFRWIAIDIPLFILLSCLALKAMRVKKYRIVIPCLSVCIIIISLLKDTDYYQEQFYRPDNILASYRQAGEQDEIVPITRIGTNFDNNGRIVLSGSRNDVMVNGGSELFCYEPVFGYFSENFPVKTMRAGSIGHITDGVFNLKNPSCYLFGEENDCSPGDHFSSIANDKVAKFINYQPFIFMQPVNQKIINYINLLSLLYVILFIILRPVFIKIFEKETGKYSE